MPVPQLDFPAPPGPVSLFRGKVRKPVTLTLTKPHHDKVDKAQTRLDLTRADVIGLLIELYADKVTKEHVARVDRKQLKLARAKRAKQK